MIKNHMRKINKLRKSLLLYVVLILFINTLMIGNIHAADIIKEDTQPSFEIIDRSSGLSNLSISSIIQDRDGFIWFGTQGGLNRYDGREMKVISNNPFDSEGLVHNLIQTMYYDSELHEIWIGTYQGISRYHIENNTFTNYTVEENQLSNPVVVAIVKDLNGDIWAGTLEGLNRINPETNEITNYELEGDVVRDLIVDSFGRLLIGSYEGLQVFDYDKNQVELLPYKLPAKAVMVVNEFQDGILSLGLWDGGIVDINMNTGEMKQQTFLDNRVYSYIQTNDGTKWIGTWGGGLFALTEEGNIHHFEGDRKEGGLNHPVVYSMLQDQSNILWIGTNGGGICKVNPLKRNYVKFKHDIENENSLDIGKINVIFQDSHMNQWFAVYNSGLNRYDEINNKMIKYEADPSTKGALLNNSIVDIIEDHEGRLLLASGAGVLIYDHETDQFSRMDNLLNDSIVYALENGVKNDLWIGTYTEGLYRYHYDDGSMEHYSFENKDKYALSDNLIYDIMIDSKNRVWVATNNGLNLLKPESDKFQVFKSGQGDYNQLASNTTRDLFEDSSGRIWIGTVGGGLSQFNENTETFTTYIENNGMPSNVILGILEGDDGRIWVSTHNGLAIITPHTGDVFAMTPDDGIGGYEFNSGHFKDNDGTLLFGGIHGITAIPDDFTNVDGLSPKVYITNIEIFQQPLDEDKPFFNDLELDFSSEQTFLGFKFVALDYDSPEKTRFNYKLIGFDKEWINSGIIDYAAYSKLPPGHYEFRVVAETARGVRSEPAVVKFSIAYPWYRTPFAYFGYFAAISILLIGMFKLWQGKQTLKKNNELAIINSKLEEANIKLEELSTVDPLTGAFNRRYFNSRMEEELQLATRSKIELTLMMLDIDYFKKINDVYGHLSGDEFLSDIGKTVKDLLPRNTDFVVRFGGDEFLIVLFDTNEEGALVVANRVKSSIEHISIKKDGYSLNKYTTSSIGLVSFIPNNETTIQIVLDTVDETLYLAKNEGRNRIFIGKMK